MRAPVTARAVGAGTVAISGPGVYDAITQLGIPRMRPRVIADKKVSVWLIPATRGEELFSYLEQRTGRRIEVTL